MEQDRTNLPHLSPYGSHALLLEGGTAEQRLQFAELIEAKPPPGFREWVMGYETLMLSFRTEITPEILLPYLEMDILEMRQTQQRQHEIPVDYSGPDLEEVARRCHLTSDEWVQRHSSAIYTVRFLGFAPGFAYLDGLPPELHCPRRDTPRPVMKPGAVAIGGSHAGIYPIASPGGWQWIGNTDTPLFDPRSSDEPFLLQPGDQIEFVPK